MIDPVAVAQKVKELAATLPAVKSALLGLNPITTTPAVEVVIAGGTIQALAASAGQPQSLDLVVLQVLFYVPLSDSLEEDEITLGTLIRDFVQLLHDPATDDTLGGLVEQTLATAYELNVTERNGLKFRAAEVVVEAGLL